MKNILTTSVAVLLLSGSISAFSAANMYIDQDSGFQLKSKPSWMEIGGKNFYGLANKPDKKEAALNIICAYTAQEVEKATGQKFTTEEFRKKFKDLQLLERNNLSPDKVDYLLFMPDAYEIKPDNKLSLAPKEFLDNSTISISTNKKGKQPYVYLHMIGKGRDTSKSLRRPLDMQIALTSENDMLYAIVSTFPLPNLQAQKDKIEEATPFSRKKIRSEFTDANREKISGYITSRETFLKGLSFFEPVKETVPYGFDDTLLGGKVNLPDNWAYVQVNDNSFDKTIPVTITIAAPWNDVSDLLTHHEEVERALDKQDVSKINFQNFKEIAFFASSRPKEKNTFADLFATPLLTNLLIDKLIKEGLDELKKTSVKEIVEFKEINTNSDFNDTYGTIKVSGNGSIKNNFSFNINARLMFTPQNFGMATYITKDMKEVNEELENIFRQIKLVKE